MASIEEQQQELLAAVAVPAPSRLALENWLAGGGPMPDVFALSRFAHALNAAAEASAAREARQAGHLPAFDALRHWLLADPSARQLEQMAMPLGISVPALQLSLASLRQRIRQRIDSSLALWAPDEESRHTLRERLRTTLTAKEGQS